MVVAFAPGQLVDCWQKIERKLLQVHWSKLASLAAVATAGAVVVEIVVDC